jgi:NADH dehydrogenase
VGATGVLGGAIACQLRAAGQAVRALVRKTADPARRRELSGWGAELVAADLKDESSLGALCADIGVVVSTASSTLSRQVGDCIETVDGQGQLNLVEAAEAAGVRHFVFISVVPVGPDHPIQRAKRAVEEKLRRSRMSWTILRPINFIESWLSSALGFNPAQGHARVLGDGNQPTSWVSLHDVARFAVAATSCSQLERKTVLLGGPDALSYHQVLQIFGELGAPSVELEYVSEAALTARLASAGTALEETYAALMLSTARGLTADTALALELLPGRLRTVREYAQRLLDPSKTKNGE